MLVYNLIKGIVSPLIRGYHRIEIHGGEGINSKQNYIVVGNHVSYLDPFYIASFYKAPLHFMAKKEAFSVPAFRWILKHLGAFPVMRESADIGAIKTALRLLKDGKSMGIFPEGTRQSEWDGEAFKQGAAFLAVKSKTPILPVAIFGTAEALPKASKWIKPVKVHILYGEPLPYVEGSSVEEVGLEIRNALEKLLVEGAKRGWKTYERDVINRDAYESN